jgi:hypothetical protein
VYHDCWWAIKSLSVSPHQAIDRTAMLWASWTEKPFSFRAATSSMTREALWLGFPQLRYGPKVTCTRHTPQAVPR